MKTPVLVIKNSIFHKTFSYQNILDRVCLDIGVQTTGIRLKQKIQL